VTAAYSIADDHNCVYHCTALQSLREKEAKSHAVVLEMIGDLPDADMAPPENVLFVCKLNPVTTDDDLEIIFTRFGPCKAEICRDHITGGRCAACYQCCLRIATACLLSTLVLIGYRPLPEATH
jgi:hypothetical protein